MIKVLLITGSDVLAILTEWAEFKTLDLRHISDTMRNKNIVDCRNLLDRNEAEKLGFTYRGIGK